MAKDVAQQISIVDNANTDAFGRLRTSNPIAQFEYQNQYNSGPLVWNESLTGTGAATHTPNTSSVLLSTGGTASGAKVVRQTKSYFRYTPGKSLLVIATFDCGNCIANSRKRIGYFDGDNGIFFEQSGFSNRIALRSKSSGEVVDQIVNQEAWNKDRMDGTGPSGLRLDFTKATILVIDVQWLGVGSVRVGFEYNGVLHVAHEFEHTNMLDAVYMTSANLPIRYEIENTGTTAEAASMSQICSTVVTEQGAIDDKGFYTHGISNGITSISVTTRRACLSIRPKATFNSITNRAKIEIEDIGALVGSANVYWELIYNGTIGGSPSWTSAGTNSVLEFDVAGTTVTGGEVVDCGYINSGGGAARTVAGKQIAALYPLCLDIAGANPTSFSLVFTALSGTATVNSKFTVREYY
jgi:hypothetical protein